MHHLRELDEVAYVRFASVYRSFRDVDEFLSELGKLVKSKERCDTWAHGAPPPRDRSPGLRSPDMRSDSPRAPANRPDREIDAARMRGRSTRRARRMPSPNPPVGAVVVDAAGEPSPRAPPRAGEAHAEVIALASGGGRRRGGTLYVTLEPCNHQGRTPPCVDAILERGHRRVVVGCLDPNPERRRRGRTAPRGGRRPGRARHRRRAGPAPHRPVEQVHHDRPAVRLAEARALARRPHRHAHRRLEVGDRPRGPQQGARAARRARRRRRRHRHGPRRRSAPDGARSEPAHLGNTAPARIVFDSPPAPAAAQPPGADGARGPHVGPHGRGRPEAAEHALVDAGCTVVRAPLGRGPRRRARGAAALGARASSPCSSRAAPSSLAACSAARLADELHVFIAPVAPRAARPPRRRRLGGPGHPLRGPTHRRAHAGSCAAATPTYTARWPSPRAADGEKLGSMRPVHSSRMVWPSLKNGRRSPP
jgi:diaminohydroxyphosphoribosylaminopyrimidine deaminase/5-amino-6-(5-phosphoribosylamino)uracil reductase